MRPGAVAPNLEDGPPLSKCLVTTIDKPWKGHLEGQQHQLGDVRSPWLLTTEACPGMILQAQVPQKCKLHLDDESMP